MPELLGSRSTSSYAHFIELALLALIDECQADMERMFAN
jgi:hypothetical protein